MKPVRKGWRLWPPVIIAKYWLLQGALYMNWVERLHRWGLELLIFLAIYALIGGLAAGNGRLAAALLAAHTLNAIINGHLFAMLTHDLFWFSRYRNRADFLRYMETMRGRLQAQAPPYVSGGVFFGSIARGVFRTSSDLDIRFIPADGLWNALRAAHLVFGERFRALLAGFPIDIYMFRSEAEVRKKMDVANELPVCVYRCGTKLEQILPETVSFETFRERFAAGA